MNKKTRVLIIGLDGGTFKLLSPLIKNDIMPNMKKIMKEGSYGTLKSTIPPFSPTAWSSFATGTNPGKHGIMGFYKITETKNLELVSSLDRHGNDFWSILSDAGKKVIVLNVPLTYPPKKVNGYMVSGMFTPPGSKNYTYPSDFHLELEKLINNNYSVYPSNNFEKGKEENYILEEINILHNQSTIAKYLMKNKDWDFFIIVFNCTDQIQHVLWDYIYPLTNNLSDLYDEYGYNMLLKFYTEVDRVVGELIKFSGNNVSTLIVSDHGFCNLSKFIHINRWLIKEGIIKFKKNIKTYFKYFIFRLNITPEVVYRVISMFGLKKMRKKANRNKTHKKLEKFFLSFNDIDWIRTDAYSFGAMGQIYINEESNNINSELEKKITINKIISNLSTLKDTNDELIIKQILLKNDLYHGPLLYKMPDIIFIPKEGYIGFEEYEFASNKVISDAMDISGSHDLDGIFLAYGGVFKKVGEIKNIIRIEDVAPTILKIFNINCPSYIDGYLIDEIFE